MEIPFKYPYKTDEKYRINVCYCCMEFGIDQSLKLYAGGLGFLAGSHMRSAYELKQPMIGVGVLWKYGYYNQVRKQDKTMDVLFEENKYGFLIDTKIKFTISVNKHEVWVTAFYLAPEIFNTAPIYFLSTDLPENDYLSKTITHKLYNSNPESKIASAILLGVGSVKLMEVLNWEPNIFHINESHALPLAFYLYSKYKSVELVKSHLVFTNHTPEESGNQKMFFWELDKMGYFCGLDNEVINKITLLESEKLNMTLSALQLSKKANAVSITHLETINKYWGKYQNICEITSITNAQNYTYWHNKEMYACIENNNSNKLSAIKKKGKRQLFEIVADQCGEIYKQDVLTIVFAKRFVGYKRADLILHNMERFNRLVCNKQMPIQIIWAGKPYPMDYTAIGIFDKIVDLCKNYSNCCILTGYELKLSKTLKSGADIWLNVPRITHEASGTSGMSAAMNGAINLAIPDGWFPEYAIDNVNSFVIKPSDKSIPDHIQDNIDSESLYDKLENIVIPMYYNQPDEWNKIMINSMKDIIPKFDSNRMALEYYDLLYK